MNCLMFLLILSTLNLAARAQSTLDLPAKAEPPVELNAPTFSLKLSSSSPVFALDSPITVDVKITNIGQAELYIDSGPAPGYRFFRYSLRKANVDVPMTELDRWLRNELLPGDVPLGYLGPTVLFRLSPDKSMNSRIDLSKLFEIKEAGEYELTVERFNVDKNQKVVSAPLKLLVR
jgi:hypothetical protein